MGIFPVLMKTGMYQACGSSLHGEDFGLLCSFASSLKYHILKYSQEVGVPSQIFSLEMHIMQHFKGHSLDFVLLNYNRKMKWKHLACQNLTSITIFFFRMYRKLYSRRHIWNVHYLPRGYHRAWQKGSIHKYYLNEWINEDHENEKETFLTKKRIKSNKGDIRRYKH